jgi:hypothetical protein
MRFAAKPKHCTRFKENKIIEFENQNFMEGKKKMSSVELVLLNFAVCLRECSNAS